MKTMVDRGDLFKYESSSNTFEIDSDLYVNGKLKINAPVNLKDATNKEYVDKLASTKVDKGYPGSKWQLYGIGSKTTPLPYGITIATAEQALPNTVINRNVDGRAEIATPVNELEIANKQYVDNLFNTKVFYRHQLKVKVGGSAVYFVITSSSNLKVASLQDLTTVTKATNGYFTLAMRPGETDLPILVTYNNNVWGSSIGAITAITEDIVTPL